MSTIQKGKIAEYRFVSEMIRKGYRVFFPVDEGGVVDLLTMKDGQILTYQIKYRDVNSRGVIQVENRATNNKRKRRRIEIEEIDFFGIYCPSNDRGYLIPMKDIAGKGSLALRVLEAKKYGKQSCIIRAQEYLFF